ncbi:Glycine-rich RNA-binding protein 2 [Spatholobus suberectus]|nr:Glycine-rich RNA-binding protein 2 [Spatholobus suberectus]
MVALFFSLYLDFYVRAIIHQPSCLSQGFPTIPMNRFSDTPLVKVICDHVTGKSRGYGLVRFVSKTTADTAGKEIYWMADAFGWVMRTKGSHQVWQTTHKRVHGCNIFNF